MINFNATFRLNPQAAQRRAQRIKVAHAALDARVIKDTDPFVPFVKGILASSVLRASTPGRLIYQTPYARRLYYGLRFNFTKVFHPQAGPKWFERAKALYRAMWLDLAARITGGRPGR